MKAKSARKSKKPAPPPLLQKWYRNDIIEATQAAGLDPRQFDLSDSGTEARWKHRWSASCFIIGGRAGHYVGQYVVGDSPAAWPYEVYSWDAVKERVTLWLRHVKLDLDTPDLWAELQHEAELLGGSSNKEIENTLFTPDEQKEIARRLNQLAKDVSHALSLSGAQIQALDEKIDYLVKASSRLGRKDWLNNFIGVTLPFVLAATLAPEAARALFLTLLQAIGLFYPELSLE
jgi:hypothetical protein